ncbi:sigma-70 family RNA polymerase sigma factor [bacterium]|nr:sigma-70 family RNA polymerase sigma factor [bacterium]
MARESNDNATEQPVPSAREATDFAELFEVSRSTVWTICYRVLHGRECEAEEAFQSTFSRLLDSSRKGAVTLSAREETLVVLRRYAYCEANALRKRLAGRTRKELVVGELPERQATGVSPRLGAQQNEERAKLEGLVEMLPERYRLPILLHYFHGMTHAQIGDALGRPLSTVSNQIARGLRKLEPMARRAGFTRSSVALAVVAGGAQLLSPPSASAAETHQVAHVACTEGSTIGGASTTVAISKGTVAAIIFGATLILVVAAGFTVKSQLAASGAAPTPSSTPTAVSPAPSKDLQATSSATAPTPTPSEGNASPPSRSY